MSLVPHPESAGGARRPDARAEGRARVTIGVVALGLNARLERAVAALRAHESHTAFDVVCVVNQCDDEAAARVAVGPDVALVARRGNLGYTGGLHLARAGAGGEFMVWGQDDMEPLPGWLDALVDAAETVPAAAVIGARQEARDGSVHPLNAGTTEPGRSSATWPSTPIPNPDRPVPVEVGWVSGAGSLVRLSAWDDAGGADLRLWPINFVDLEFCAHVRAHGWSVVHAPAARLIHDKRGSTPSLLVGYTGVRNTQIIDARWADAGVTLPARGGARLEHECAPWRGAPTAEIEQWQLDEASRAYLPLFAHYTREVTALREDVARLSADVIPRADVERSRSWRLTAPLRWASAAMRRKGRRAD